MSTAFQLRFPAQQIDHWSERYEYDDQAAIAVVPAAKQRGSLTKEEFLAVCHWKSPRTQPRCRTNSAEFIEHTTRCALSSASEQLRIEVLTLLRGVSWPTASVILHFFHSEQYPIVDFRALWSLNCDVPAQYEYPFWQEYTQYCRNLAKESGASMRKLDRALWQYSKEHQA